MTTIALPEGSLALIDDCDLERLSGYHWHEFAPSGKRIYVSTEVWSHCKRKRVYMHRIVLAAPDDLQVDHINGDGLDNRRCNLRLATQAENSANRSKTHGRFAYKGLRFHAGRRKPWAAQITQNYKAITIGYYATPAEAAAAYDEKAQELFGEFARLNFPAERSL